MVRFHSSECETALELNLCQADKKNLQNNQTSNSFWVKKCQFGKYVPFGISFVRLKK